ncbi:MAG: competence/damage-inducible protein A [Thermodesulfovibrionales bacterium]|nr:competence/damage-inducible protein A [Thermodesulfovibrionales bacterium]
MAKTAAIIIIGNEILSGKIRDGNSPYLAGELRALGVNLRSIEIISDNVEAIAERIASCSKAHDIVFTSGGVGPTHDDVTMQGVARGLGLGTVQSQQMAELLRDTCRIRESDAISKMSEIPEGAELIAEGDMFFPLVRVKNVYVFPGVPEYLKDKFEAVKERFREKPFILKKVFVNREEFCIAHIIDHVAVEFPDVIMGSYPKIKEPDYKVMVTLEDTDSKRLEKATKRLVDELPEGSVVRTE